MRRCSLWTRDRDGQRAVCSGVQTCLWISRESSATVSVSAVFASINCRS